MASNQKTHLAKSFQNSILLPNTYEAKLTRSKYQFSGNLTEP
jgi:hypothetical protein